MHKPLLIAPAILALALFAPAVPAAGINGGYVSLSALGALSDIDDLRLADESVPVELIDPEPEIVVGLSPAIGYSFDDLPLRVELQYLWRYRFDIDAQTLEPSPRAIKSDVATHSGYFNAYYDFTIADAWDGYVVAGIGFAHHSLETESFAVPGAGEVDTDEDNFVWQAGVGIRRELGERWLLDASYRYNDLGSLETGGADLVNLQTNRYFSHDFLVGVAYPF